MQRGTPSPTIPGKTLGNLRIGRNGDITREPTMVKFRSTSAINCVDILKLSRLTFIFMPTP
jgi:hypothetical protein